MDVVARAQGLAGEVTRRADEIEQARRLPSDLSRAFAQAGFYRACVPVSRGGLECDPMSLVRMIETLAHADGSAAWVAFIAATTGSLGGYLSDAGARTVFGDPLSMACGVAAPRGKAEKAEGGWRVTGRWQWGSGSDNADWILAGCVITEGGEPVMTDAGPKTLMAFVPRADVTLTDNWHVSGLRGTGSQDFAIAAAVVPEDLCTFAGRPPSLDRPLYQFPWFSLLALGIAGVSLGLARAAISELIEVAVNKIPEAHRRTLANRPHTQEAVATAEALVRSGRAFLFEAIEAAWATATSGGRVSMAERRDLRLATTHATRSAAQAIDLMYNLGGGTSVYATSGLQRRFRDVHVATQHMMVGVPVMETAGRQMLGFEVAPGQL